MLNAFVEFLVCACGFCSVEIASTNDMAICCVEVEGICNIVEVAKREVLPLSRSAICGTSIRQFLPELRQLQGSDSVIETYLHREIGLTSTSSWSMINLHGAVTQRTALL